jgi:hypothetical protein
MRNKSLDFLWETTSELLEHIRRDTILLAFLGGLVLLRRRDKTTENTLVLDKHHWLPLSPPESVLFVKVGRVGSVGDGFKEFNFIDWAIRRSLNTEAFLTSTFFSSRFCLLLFIRVLGITEDSTLWLSLSIESRSCTSRKLGGFTSCQQ